MDESLFSLLTRDSNGEWVLEGRALSDEDVVLTIPPDTIILNASSTERDRLTT